MKVGRNDPCTCGSGKKYKKCCLIHDLAASSQKNQIDYTWHKLRSLASGKLFEKIFHYTLDRYQEVGFSAAWDEFFGFPEEELSEHIDKDMIMGQAFAPWLAYNWIPDLSVEEISKLDVQDIPAAEEYLKRYDSRVDSYERRFIEENIKTHYSVFQVKHVVIDKSLALHDVLRNKDYLVQEKAATHNIDIGRVIFARIITLDGCSIADGMYPISLPPDNLLPFIDLKDKISKGDQYSLDDKDLDEWSFEIRSLFLSLIEQGFSSLIPQIQNSDGEDFIDGEVYFSSHCSPEEAYDQLYDLSQDIADKKEILKSGLFDKHGELVEIEFPWAKKRGQKSSQWNNSILGHIKISKSEIIVDVNSNERAERIRKEIINRLGDKVTYRVTKIESMEQKLKDIPNQSQAQTLIDLNDSPETQEVLKSYMDEYWKSWLDQKIPALENQTPREASTTKLGRERLEALLTDFHSKNSQDNSQPAIDFAFLRRELGMD